MSISPARRIAYRLFAQTLLLVLAYTSLSLIHMTSTLPVAFVLPAPQFPGSEHLLTLAVLTGLFGAAIYLVTDERPGGDLRPRWAVRAWAAGWSLFTGGGVGVVLAGGGGKAPALALISAGFATGLGVILLANLPRRDLRLFALLGGVLLSNLSPEVRLHLGYPLAGAALGFWLMHRFSNVTPAWAQLGLRSVGGLLMSAGVLGLLAPADRLIGLCAAAAIPFAWMIFAAHSHRALSDPNTNRTLAGYWLAAGVLLFLLANGTLGALNSLPTVRAWTTGTPLETLLHWMSAWAIGALVLATLNQAGAELRGENRRITGLLPYWCVVFGTVWAALGGFGDGISTVLLRRAAGLGAADIQAYSGAFRAFQVFGLVVQAVGVATYALGFWTRRPRAES